MSSFQDEEVPRSVSQGEYRDDNWLLTHANWHSSPTFTPQPETGVRKVVDGKVQEGFRLIQHGCPDFKSAEKVIVAALNKGWDECRICDLIQWMRQRRRVKARTA